MISVDVVELWESVVTFLLFPILTIFAYAADKGWCGLGVISKSKNKQQLELGPLRGDESKSKILSFKNSF